jgi:hypothetical protein
MYQYEIYVPSEFKFEVQYVIDTFAIFYGGATSYETEGVWRDDDGLPHRETVTVIRSISATEQDRPARDSARYIENACNQETVLWTKQAIQSTFETFEG